MSDNDKALTFRSKPCPLCGAKPHHGLTKVKHCQLHGDPYQNFRIWCPHGCCQVECGDGERARAKWDNRPNENADSMSQHCPNCEAQAAEIERLKAEVKNAWCDDALPCRQLMDAKQEIERLRGVIRQAVIDGDVKASPLPPTATLGETK